MGARRFENPLLSDKRLREMYQAMIETRTLGQSLRRGKRRGFAVGMEACWVGSAIGLRDGEGDFVCAGDGVAGVLDRVLGLGMKQVRAGGRASSRLEMDGAKPVERICFALGAASRMIDTKTVGLLYAGVEELTATQWKHSLAESLRLALPVVFVAIPRRGCQAAAAELAGRCGVPGIPVDAADAVAMYRVAQESIGRARAGGGPALIEAIVLPGAGDPVSLLRAQLVAKKVVTERWATALEEKLRAKLAR